MFRLSAPVSLALDPAACRVFLRLVSLPGRLNGGAPWSTLPGRLVAVPGPRAWPFDAWAVPLVSHHLGRWPRALDLVPAGLVRGPWTWCRPAWTGRAGGYLVRA